MSEESIDLARFRSNVGDDEELVQELLGVYVESGVRMRGALEAAVRTGDAREVMRAAHALKGALLTLCAAPAVRLAEQMERHARAGDGAAACALWPGLDEELGRLELFIAQHRT